jgi:hypothetical protein
MRRGHCGEYFDHERLSDRRLEKLHELHYFYSSQNIVKNY